MDLLDLLQYIVWYPGIGDPTIIGRMTVVAYLGTAVLCLLCGFIHPAFRHGNHKRRQFWFSLAGMLFLLGLIKQYNLLSRLTAFFRQQAWEGNWYASRWKIDFVAILISFLLSIMVMVLLKHGWDSYRVASIGFGFLLFFVLFRATSFHYIDQMINWRLAGIRVNWILEYSGIGCVGMTAMLTLGRHRQYRLTNAAENG
jgi:hypothetical protein